MSDTRDVTILPKAVPIMTPTAKSTTFPLIANALNSAMNDAIGRIILCTRKGLFLNLGQGANSSGAQSHANAANLLGLDVDFECSPRGDIRMAPRISGGGAATGEGAYSAHN